MHLLGRRSYTISRSSLGNLRNGKGLSSRKGMSPWEGLSTGKGLAEAMFISIARVVWARKRAVAMVLIVVWVRGHGQLVDPAVYFSRIRSYRLLLRVSLLPFTFRGNLSLSLPSRGIHCRLPLVYFSTNPALARALSDKHVIGTTYLFN